MTLRRIAPFLGALVLAGAAPAGEPILLRMLSVGDAEALFHDEAERLLSRVSAVFEASADRATRPGWAQRTYPGLEERGAGAPGHPQKVIEPRERITARPPTRTSLSVA